MLPEMIVTDFAGTTLAESGAVLAAYRQSLEEHQIPFTEADLAARRGASKRAVFLELAGRVQAGPAAAATAESALARFEALLGEHYERGDVHEVPGAEASLRRLKEEGIKVALGSGFERGLVELLLGRLGWVGLFDHVTASQDVPQGRPAPFMIYRPMIDLGIWDVGRVAVVGDTPLDLQAGMNARAGWVIGVLTGAHGIETLGKTAHTHLARSIADLPSLFGLSA